MKKQVRKKVEYEHRWPREQHSPSWYIYGFLSKAKYIRSTVQDSENGFHGTDGRDNTIRGMPLSAGFAISSCSSVVDVAKVLESALSTTKLRTNIKQFYSPRNGHVDPMDQAAARLIFIAVHRVEQTGNCTRKVHFAQSWSCIIKHGLWRQWILNVWWWTLTDIYIFNAVTHSF